MNPEDKKIIPIEGRKEVRKLIIQVPEALKDDPKFKIEDKREYIRHHNKNMKDHAEYIRIGSNVKESSTGYAGKVHAIEINKEGKPILYIDWGGVGPVPRPWTKGIKVMDVFKPLDPENTELVIEYV